MGVRILLHFSSRENGQVESLVKQKRSIRNLGQLRYSKADGHFFQLNLVEAHGLSISLNACCHFTHCLLIE